MRLSMETVINLGAIFSLAVYAVWIAMSLGVIVPSSTTLAILALLIVVINMYVVDNVGVNELYTLGDKFLNFSHKGVSLIMLGFLVSGNLVFWWYWISIYLILAIYIAVRRPELYNSKR